MDKEYYVPDHPEADEYGAFTFKSDRERKEYINTLSDCEGCAEGDSHSFNTKEHGLEGYLSKKSHRKFDK